MNTTPCFLFSTTDWLAAKALSTGYSLQRKKRWSVLFFIFFITPSLCAQDLQVIGIDSSVGDATKFEVEADKAGAQVELSDLYCDLSIQANRSRAQAGSVTVAVAMRDILASNQLASELNLSVSQGQGDHTQVFRPYPFLPVTLESVKAWQEELDKSQPADEFFSLPEQPERISLMEQGQQESLFLYNCMSTDDLELLRSLWKKSHASLAEALAIFIEYRALLLKEANKQTEHVPLDLRQVSGGAV